MWLFLINVRSYQLRWQPANIKLQDLHVLDRSLRISSRSWYRRNTFHSNIMNLYRDHPASTSLGKEEGEDEEIHKKWHRKEGVRWKKWCLSHKFLYVSHKFLYVFFPVTQSLFLLGFSSGPGNITASNKISTFKKVSTSISEITINYLHNNIVIPTLY